MLGSMIVAVYLFGLGGGAAFFIGVICLGVVLFAGEIVAATVETIWREGRR